MKKAEEAEEVKEAETEKVETEKVEAEKHHQKVEKKGKKAEEVKGLKR